MQPGQPKTKELPFVSVCPKCGLSHRAVVTHNTNARAGKTFFECWAFGKKKCVCGEKTLAYRPWVGIRIRQGEKYDGNMRELLDLLRWELVQ
jgi:hypothetical protein